ncbi:MAG: hypothetical protein ACFCU2_11950 [Acidimicrobiia bacterium]
MTRQIPFLEELREELLDRADAPFVTQARRPRPRRTLVIAVASFVGTLLLGGVAWFIASLGSQPASLNLLDEFDWDLAITLPAPDNSTDFLQALEQVPGVAAIVEYFPDHSVLYPSEEPDESDASTETTVEGQAEGVEPPPIAVALVTIDDVEDASIIAMRLESAFDVYQISFSAPIARLKSDEFWDQMAAGAEVLDEDPLFLQPPPGPEPLFDTSGLGNEVVLMAAEPGYSIPGGIAGRPGGLTRDLDPDSSRPVINISRPVINIGTVSEIGATLVIFATSDGSTCEAVVVEGGSGMGCGDFSHEAFGITSSGSQGQAGYAVARVPGETTVVRLSVNDDQSSWQRPIAGFALFPTDAWDTTFRVTAFDQFGEVIGEWVTEH